MMMDVHQLAKELEVSESAIYQWASQRRIPFVRLGRSLRFEREAILDWLNGKKVVVKDI